MKEKDIVRKEKRALDFEKPCVSMMPVCTVGTPKSQFYVGLKTYYNIKQTLKRSILVVGTQNMSKNSRQS